MMAFAKSHSDINGTSYQSTPQLWENFKESAQMGAVYNLMSLIRLMTAHVKAGNDFIRGGAEEELRHKKLFTQSVRRTTPPLLHVCLIGLHAHMGIGYMFSLSVWFCWVAVASGKFFYEKFQTFRLVGLHQWTVSISNFDEDFPDATTV